MVADLNWPITRFGVDLNRTIPSSVVDVAGTRVTSTSYHHMVDTDVSEVGLNGIESVDDLRALSAITGEAGFALGLDTIYLKSYHAGLNKGGGVFFLDAADTTTADDSFTVIVDLTGRRWKRDVTGQLTCYMAGAKGDAVVLAGSVTAGTDDTAAINLFLDYMRDRILGATS